MAAFSERITALEKKKAEVAKQYLQAITLREKEIVAYFKKLDLLHISDALLVGVLLNFKQLSQVNDPSLKELASLGTKFLAKKAPRLRPPAHQASAATK